MQGSYSPSLTSSDESHDASYNFSERSAGSIYHGVGRSVSGSSSSSMYGRSQAPSQVPRNVRRVEDVFVLVRERVFQWSYLMQWYNGDQPWLNTVHVERSALEAALGTKQLDTLARQEYALGLSLAALFDIAGAQDFLRAAYQLMGEWEQWSEQSANSGKVVGPIRNFFRPRRPVPRPSAAQSTSTAEVTIASIDASSDAFLVLAVMPFTPDYFQVHASTCSIIRDVYKKILNMLLPNVQGVRSNDPAYGTLLHPTAFINIRGNDTGIISVATDAALFGDMPKNSAFVGEGQKLVQPVIDLLLKVDSRLKKHYLSLVRDGDTIARRVLDDELSALNASMTSGPALRFNPPVHLETAA
ncbi:hypothetical protein CC85DRAFT_286475 [Cutaneotrichosporon oleaginosum]|uniref:Uncharacterized protein n=1 Tax=Cutaneotrichosporon oleaginosum TaxID=879819 RepID=A0A0J0XK28_9TREE|nr:uncharacterized protein CC85DRAFT_286475 [Cutaneotrichosporon oleaginosum]KLT41443.1 hypothetical protein CC85DRAFT_286475 [Cutaneotrichosporon oleaginosum]TXT12204.1 hypothetical protein COLE_02614 [Cutaneotrichosporon oleaginosum]